VRGSGYPSLDDTFNSFTEATLDLAGNLPNEIAEAIMATELSLGTTPRDLSSIASTTFADVAALLLARSRFEIGQFTHPASTIRYSVTFSHARFTVAPKVFLVVNGQQEPDGDETWGVDNEATTGFDAMRRITGVTGSASTRLVTYLAIQWAE